MLQQVTANDSEYEKVKQEAQSLYSTFGRVFAPALNEQVHFTPDGFEHLVRKDGHIERERADQLARFKLLPQAVKLVEIATVYQAYERWVKGFPVQTGKGTVIRNKLVRYWELHGIVDGRKIEVTIKKIGDNGTLRFWSVRPDWDTNRHGDIRFQSTMKGNPEED